MSILAEARRNNIIAALKGVTFTNPFIRQAFGQSPSKLEIVYLSRRKLGQRIQEEIRRQKKPFLVVVRNEQQLVENVILVPFEKKNDTFQIVSPFDMHSQAVSR